MSYLLDVPYFDRHAMKISFLHVIDRFQQCNRNLTVAHQPLYSYFPPWSESYSIRRLFLGGSRISQLFASILDCTWRKFIYITVRVVPNCQRKT